MSDLYRFGLLVLVFGGFIALNSSGTFSEVGMLTLCLGFVIGVFDLVRSGRPDSN